MTPDTMRAAVGAIAQKLELWEPGIGSIHMTAEDLIAFGVECSRAALEEGGEPRNVTASEEKMLREAAKRSSKLVAPGKLVARESLGEPFTAVLYDNLESLYTPYAGSGAAASPTAAPKEEGEPVAPNDDEVICPGCAHQFRAIPVNVQRLMLDAGFEPPFARPIAAVTQGDAKDAAEQSLGLYAAQAEAIRELLDQHAPHTTGNLQARIAQALGVAFPDGGQTP